MNSTRYVLSVMRALILLLWTPTIALAGAVVAAVGRQPLVLDWVVVGVSAVLATMAGATALAIRVNNLLLAVQPGEKMVRPWLFAAAHMLGSWSAGTAAFLIGQAQHTEVWTSLLLVLLAAFAGAKFLEMAAERWLPVVRPKP